MKEAEHSSESTRSASKRPHTGPRVADLQADAEAVVTSVQVAARDAETFVRTQTTQRPYVSLGVAAGVGFVLGGGLSPKLTATLLGLGGRILVNAVLREVAESR